MSLAVPTVTGYQPFWSLQAPPTQGAPYAPLFARSSQERRASLALTSRGYRAVRKDILTLIGAAAGTVATDTFSQRTATPGVVDSGISGPQGGGAVPIGTVTTINRATTAADITYIKNNIINKLFDMNPLIASYPVDASGNGGGGKVGR